MADGHVRACLCAQIGRERRRIKPRSGWRCKLINPRAGERGGLAPRNSEALAGLAWSWNVLCRCGSSATVLSAGHAVLIVPEPVPEPVPAGPTRQCARKLPKKSKWQNAAGVTGDDWQLGGRGRPMAVKEDVKGTCDRDWNGAIRIDSQHHQKAATSGSAAPTSQSQHSPASLLY